jgi:hypothetical protein
MSLINDALKRAHQAQAAAPPLTDSSAAPLHPAQNPASRPAWVWLWYAGALTVAAVLAIAAIVIGYVVHHNTKSNQLAVAARATQAPRGEASLPPNAAATSGAEEQMAPIPELTAVPALPPIMQALPLQMVREFAIPKEDQPGTNPTPSEPAKPAAPILKLQGIFYRKANPTAMINSKMLGRGESILNAKVLAITPESVTLEREGEKLVLTLP